MTFTITPRAVRILGYAIAGLLVLHLGTLFARFVLGRETMLGLVPLFDFNEEGNVPTLFTTLLLLACAGLAFLVGVARRAGAGREGAYWLFLAAVFIFMGVDESMNIHEQLVTPVQEALGGTSGALFFAWVIPYGLAVLLLGLVYLRFVWRLPARVRALIFLAGGLYVAGALGMEIVGGEYLDWHGGERDVIFALMATVEETLEMVGLAVFVLALLTYIHASLGGIDLRIAPSARADAPPGNPRAVPEG